MTRPPFLPLPAIVATAILALALSTACGPSTTPTETESPADVSAKDAARGARDLLKEIYGGLRRGDIPGLQSLAIPELFVVGPAASDVFTTREDAVVALTRALRVGQKHKLTSRGLQVNAAPGGHSAWVLDTLDVDGEPYLLGAVLSESDELWTVVAVHVGRADASSASSKKRPAPAALPGGVDAAAAEPMKLFRAFLAAPADLPDQLAGSKAVTLAGPGAKDQARGKKAIRKLWKKRAAAGLTMSLDGEPRAGVTPDGALAWILANVDIAAGEDARPIPHRVLALYQRGEEGWQLIALHFTLGVR